MENIAKDDKQKYLTQIMRHTNHALTVDHYPSFYALILLKINDLQNMIGREQKLALD